VIELRGDEALAVFASPRQALRSAMDLQLRFVEETVEMVWGARASSGEGTRA
jgi:hypothetical protein